MSLVTPLKRTAIIVRDMERSLQFYRDILGMNIWVSGTAGAELPAMYQLLGMPPCNTRWFILQSGNIDWGMVGLFELTDPAPDDETHPSIDRVNRGEACLVFHTPDVDAVYAGAQAIGLTVLCPPMRLELRQHGVVSKEMTLRDPNGVLLNFIQNIKGGSIGISNRFPGLAKGVKNPSINNKLKRKSKRISRAAPKRARQTTPKAKAKTKVRNRAVPLRRRSAGSARGRRG